MTTHLNSDKIIIDCSNHILGRLSSTVAKQLLKGKKIVLLHCENTIVTGSNFRVLKRYQDQFRKRTNFNRRRAHYHFRQPAMIVRRTVRTMLPKHQARGTKALKNLISFDGMPDQFTGYDHCVIPNALKDVRVLPQIKTSVLGVIAYRLGWRQRDNIEHFNKISADRVAKRHADRAANLAKMADMKVKNAEVKSITEKLAAFGYN